MQAWGEPAPSASSALAAPRDSAAPSALERQILELEAQKTAAFDRDDMEECTRLRDRQMLLLEQAQPGSKGEIGAVPSEALSGQLQKEVASVMGEVEELAALREELEADLAASRRAAAGRQASSASSGGSGGAAVDARAETMRAVAELEELKLRLMNGRSLEECGIVDDGDSSMAIGGWADASSAPSSSSSAARAASEPEAREVAAAAAAATDTAAMMAEMAQLNAEMDAELASLSRAVGAAKAQRTELGGMRDALLQQFEETRQEVYRTEDTVEAKAF